MFLSSTQCVMYFISNVVMVKDFGGLHELNVLYLLLCDFFMMRIGQ
jgi:hypothetical protein